MSITTNNTGTFPTDGQSNSPLMDKADRYLVIAIALAGTWAFGIVAVPFGIMAAIYMNRAQKAGQLTRPWTVTIIGSVIMVDAAINAYGWGMDFMWSHNTTTLQTLWTGYGKLVDGAYYIDYNNNPFGGNSNFSEKSVEVFGILLMYTMRVAACWGFLKMKRWGLQGLVITSWLYIGFWMNYVAGMYQDFDARMGVSDTGVFGIWFVLIVYAGPFVFMPYLYTINRELFSD